MPRKKFRMDAAIRLLLQRVHMAAQQRDPLQRLLAEEVLAAQDGGGEVAADRAPIHIAIDHLGAAQPHRRGQPSRTCPANTTAAPHGGGRAGVRPNGLLAVQALGRRGAGQSTGTIQGGHGSSSRRQPSPGTVSIGSVFGGLSGGSARRVMGAGTRGLRAGNCRPVALASGRPSGDWQGDGSHLDGQRPRAVSMSVAVAVAVPILTAESLQPTSATGSLAASKVTSCSSISCSRPERISAGVGK